MLKDHARAVDEVFRRICPNFALAIIPFGKLASVGKQRSRGGAVVVLRPSAGVLHFLEPKIDVRGIDVRHVPRKSLLHVVQPSLRIQPVTPRLLFLLDVLQEQFYQVDELDRREL